MKKLAVVLMTLLISSALLITACSSNSSGTPQSSQAPTKTPAQSAAASVAPSATSKEIDKNMTATIMCWCGAEFDKEFNKVYPNIKVEHKSASNEEFLTAVAAGSGAPDVFQVGDGSFMTLKLVNGLENLLDAPYNAGQYKSKYNDVLWKTGLTYDGKKMFGLPQQMNPYVMYYRADLMEANGYPSDPDALGKLIASPDGFFKMAAELRAKGVTFFKHAREVGDLSSNGEMFFDNNFKYVRNSEFWEKAMDNAKRALQLDLIFPGNDDERKQALASGKMLTFFDNISSFTDVLNMNPQDQKGKWRITTNPFGQIISRSMQMYVIPSQSKNKEAAWAFIQFATATKQAAKEMYKTGKIPGNKDFWNIPEIEELGKRDLLKDQNLIKFGISLMDKVKFASGNPLDDQSRSLWNKKVNDAIANSKDSRTTLVEMQDLIEKTFSKEIESYKKQAGIK